MVYYYQLKLDRLTEKTFATQNYDRRQLPKVATIDACNKHMTLWGLSMHEDMYCVIELHRTCCQGLVDLCDKVFGRFFVG